MMRIFLGFFLMKMSLARFMLNDYITHYEPVFSKHHEKIENFNQNRRRMAKPRLTLDITAFDRHFELSLSPRKFSFQLYESIPVFSGQVVGQEGSYVSGHIIDGIFGGFIEMENEIYHFERASRYFDYDRTFHSVVFRNSDITFNHTHGGNHKCGVEEHSIEHHSLQKSHKKQKNPPAQVNSKNIPSPDSQGAGTKTRNRRGITAVNNTCSVQVIADQTFFEQHGGSLSVVVAEILTIFDAVDRIFASTPFFGNQIPVRISYENPVVFESANDPRNFVANTGNDEAATLAALTKNSAEYSDKCLIHLLTHRDYSGGVLGRAWVGGPNSGICAGAIQRTSNYNTGLSSSLNYGQNVPRSVNILTITHELGHGFGAPHDSVECVGDGDGNYVMYYKATSGTLENNDKFSECSISRMKPLLEQKDCFTRFPEARCGNGIVEAGEECDSSGNDNCCSDECELFSNATCSYFSSLCCDEMCQIQTQGTVCRDEGECTNDSICDGNSSKCPAIEVKSFSTTCGLDNVTANPYLCSNGVCSSRRSLCELNRTTTCPCQEDECTLCCSSGSECKPYHLLFGDPNHPIYHSTLKTCQNSAGYCNAGSCEVVFGDSAPTITGFSSASSFFEYTWYFWVAGIGSIILFIALYMAINKLFPSSGRLRRMAIEEQMKAAQTERKKLRDNHIPLEDKSSV